MQIVLVQRDVTELTTVPCKFITQIVDATHCLFATSTHFQVASEWIWTQDLWFTTFFVLPLDQPLLPFDANRVKLTFLWQHSLERSEFKIWSEKHHLQALKLFKRRLQVDLNSRSLGHDIACSTFSAVSKEAQSVQRPELRSLKREVQRRRREIDSRLRQRS